MAKIVARYGNKFWGVVGFELLGSIILLGCALFIASSWSHSMPWYTSFFLSVGIISSFSLFFLTFGNLSLINSLSKMMFEIASLSAVSLVFVAIGNWPVVSLIITGYVVEMIGTLLGMPKDG